MAGEVVNMNSGTKTQGGHIEGVTGTNPAVTTLLNQNTKPIVTATGTNSQSNPAVSSAGENFIGFPTRQLPTDPDNIIGNSPNNAAAISSLFYNGNSTNTTIPKTTKSSSSYISTSVLSVLVLLLSILI